MEQAKQMAQIKTNEAQHAHLAMKQAEDEARKFKQETLALKKKAEDFELEITKRASEQAEAQRIAEMQRMQSNVPTIDSDFSHSNTYEYSAPMGFGGYPGAPATSQPQLTNDADIMGGYASSVGYTDNSVYSVNNSITGSINYGTGALPVNYTNDAASHSVTSEPLLYPSVETPSNAGRSVTGVLGTTGSIAQPGSITNMPTGYTSDTSEIRFNSNNDINSLTSADNHNKPPLPDNNDITYKPPLDTSTINHPSINQTATSASNDTETMNNTTSASTQINGNVVDVRSESNITETNNQQILQMKSNEMSIGSSDFGSYQSPDFDGIPSPEKVDNEFVAVQSPAFNNAMINDDTVPIVNQEQSNPSYPDTIAEQIPNATTNQEEINRANSSDMNLIPTPEKVSEGDIKQGFEVQEEISNDYVDVVAVAAPAPATYTEVVSARSGETSELETVYLAEETQLTNKDAEEGEEVAKSNIDESHLSHQPFSDDSMIPSPDNDLNTMTSGVDSSVGLIPSLDVGQGATSDDGLIPSPGRGSSSLTQGTTSDDGLIPSPGKDTNAMTQGAVMSLSTDSEFPNSIANDGDDGNDEKNNVMNNNQSNDILNTATDAGAPTNFTVPPPLPPPLGASNSADCSTNFGIMSQSSDGGIPTPTNSKDEYDKSFM